MKWAFWHFLRARLCDNVKMHHNLQFKNTCSLIYYKGSCFRNLLFSPGVSIWDLDRHKLPLCLPQRFWHLYHLKDPPSVTMQSSNYKCGGQRNVRLLTSLLHADWNDIAEFQSYCSHSLTIEQRPSMCSFSSSFGGRHPTGNVFRGYQPVLAQSSGGWPETIEHWPCFCLEKDK